MKRIVYQLCAIALLVSCQQEIGVDTPKEMPSGLLPMAKEITIKELPQARIGRKIQNPFEIDNVRLAFNQLDQATKAGLSEEEIKPTHHYVAFTPSNDEELAAVQSIDENQIIIHYYPLDYEVSDGIITPDERFMINGYSFYWAYVPVGYDLSTINCPYIMYYDIVALDDEIVTTKAGSKLSLPVIEALINKAYSLSGNGLNPIIQTKADVHPSGFVKFYDTDYQSFRPVDGFKVRAVRGTHQCWMNCDASGYFYSSDTFKYSFQYEFMFRRDNFEIVKNDDSNFAIIKLSGQTGPVNVNFQDDESCVMATIDRAAISYYYGDNLGLVRPPSPSDYTRRLTIHTKFSSASDPLEMGHFYVKNAWPLYPHPFMYVYRIHDGSERALKDIYSTTIHELAHASMWLHNPSIDNVEKIVYESYATGIQWALTTNEYDELYSGRDYYRCSYTGIIQDLIDNPELKQKRCEKVGVYNSQGVFELKDGSYKSYLDLLSGLDLTIIESCAMNSRTWNEWKNNLISYYPSYATNIGDAFDFWNSKD